MRGLKEPGLGPPRIRERSPLEAEQLGLQQGLRNGRTVDVHEEPAAAHPMAMEQPGHQPLARAGVALDEDRRQSLPRPLSLEQPAQPVPDHLDSPALSEQFTQLVHDHAALA